MHKDNHNSPLAISYATSLLELATEQGKLDETTAELRDLREIVDTNPTFAAFLSDRAIGDMERAEFLKKVFGGRISPLLMNFLLVMNEHERLGQFSAVVGAFDDLLSEKLGKIEVDVTVAQRLTNDQLEQVRKKVSAALKKDAVVHQYVDESIIGGLVLRVQDQLIDGSTRTQLRLMRQQLLSGRPR